MTAAPTAYSSVCAPPVVGETLLSRDASRMPATIASVEHEDEADRLDVRDVDAGAPRGLGVAADRVDVPAERRAHEQEREHDHERDHQRHDPRHALDDDRRRGTLALLVEQVDARSTRPPRGRPTLAPHTDSAGVGNPARLRRRIARNELPAKPPMTITRQQPAQRHRHVLVHHRQDRVVADRDRPALADDQQHRALQAEEEGQRDDERRDARAGRRARRS